MNDHREQIATNPSARAEDAPSAELGRQRRLIKDELERISVGLAARPEFTGAGKIRLMNEALAEARAKFSQRAAGLKDEIGARIAALEEDVARQNAATGAEESPVVALLRETRRRNTADEIRANLPAWSAEDVFARIRSARAANDADTLDVFRGHRKLIEKTARLGAPERLSLDHLLGADGESDELREKRLEAARLQSVRDDLVRFEGEALRNFDIRHFPVVVRATTGARRGPANAGGRAVRGGGKKNKGRKIR